MTTTTIDEVRHYLELMDRMVVEMAGRHDSPPASMLCIESIVLKLGRAWTPKARPAGMRKMRNGLCYMNAYRIQVFDGGLRYVEGYAASPDSLIPVAHGWCVNEQDEVVDPTWKDPERTAYYGIEIPEDLLHCSMALTRVYGFFGSVRTGKLVSELGRLPTVDELQRAHKEERCDG